MVAEHLPRGDAFWSGSFAMGCGMSISRYTDLPPVRLHAIGQGLRTGRLWLHPHASIQPYQVGNLQAWDEELVDFHLADSSTGSHISPSLRQDA